MKAELRQLTTNDGREIYNMLQQIPASENGFVNTAHGLAFPDFWKWLKRQDEMSRGQGLEPWMVPQTTYWLYVNDRPVGYGKVRHHLTEDLRNGAGHIGYAVAPLERNKGYGKTLLRLLLHRAKGLGIEVALLSVEKDNLPSLQVVEENHGVFLREDELKNFYLIPTI